MVLKICEISLKRMETTVERIYAEESLESGVEERRIDAQ